MEDLVAQGAGVVRILEVFHEKGDQTAADHQPAQDEDEAHEPGEGSYFVRDVGVDLLVAARASGRA